MIARVALLAAACACGRLGFDPIVPGETSGLQRKPIAIRPGFTATTSLSDFPVAVVIAADAELAAGARPDGTDLAFTAADGTTPLAFELEHYDGAAGALVAWVREPVLAGSTMAYLYYGGQPAAHDPTQTWPGCLGVWHMAGLATEPDSTVHAHELVPRTGTSPPSTAPGVAGPARALDGAVDSLEIADPPDGSLDMGARSFSITLWVNVTSPAGLFDNPLFKGGADDATPGYDFEIGTNEWRTDIGDGAHNVYPNLGSLAQLSGQWTQLANVTDRGTQQLVGYVDGAPVMAVDISAVGSIDSALPLDVGPAADPYRGMIDELRIYDHALPAAWISAEYRNLTDPSFVTVGPAEPAP